jgi:hypothetical protein
MALYLFCPNGHALSTVDDASGQTVQCPLCRVVVTVPSVEGPVASPLLADAGPPASGAAAEPAARAIPLSQAVATQPLPSQPFSSNTWGSEARDFIDDRDVVEDEALPPGVGEASRNKRDDELARPPREVQVDRENAPKRKKRKAARGESKSSDSDADSGMATRNVVFGAIGTVLGASALVNWLASGMTFAPGAYGYGQMAGLVLGFLLFVAGLYYLLNAKAGRRKK